MRWLVAPQEFKGALTATQAANAMAAGILEADPSAEIDLCPLADGGPGTVDAALTVTGAIARTALVRDPLGRSIRAVWAELPGATAVVEMAAASGLSLLRRDERSALVTSTRGTGELLLDALSAGCGSFLLGVGGSATNDAGAGALQALGVRLLDADGAELRPGGRALLKLAEIDVSRCRLRGALRVGTDVRNPLLGPTGASAIYGPQKGATADDVALLDSALAHFAQVVKRSLGRDVAAVAGTGAAGGLAYGMHAVLGAELLSGFDAVSELVGLRSRLQRADIVVTGEGKLDTQTAYGKGPVRIATMAKELGKRACAVVGVTAPGADSTLFERVVEASPAERPGTIDEAVRRVRTAAASLARS